MGANLKRTRKPATAALTELEGIVLGMISTSGSCTPYAVRRKFRTSPSRYWSASAGAVYPLFTRLKKQGFLRAERKAGDGRGSRLFSLTTMGQRTLREWLGPPCPPAVTSVPPDPLRNRVALLAALGPAEQAQFLAETTSNVRAHLRELSTLTEQIKVKNDVSEFLVCRGAVRMLEARLNWLEEVSHYLGEAT
jgi:DNA-binding PadR family transcriptional regulator